MVIDGLSFSYIDNRRLCVSDKYKHKAIFQLRDNYMPLLIYSDLSEKNTYKAMLLVERNNVDILYRVERKIKRPLTDIERNRIIDEFYDKFYFYMDIYILLVQ